MQRCCCNCVISLPAGAALTEPCDGDVQLLCEGEAGRHRRGVFSIGAVGRCLAQQLGRGSALDGECRELVMAAAPLVCYNTPDIMEQRCCSPWFCGSCMWHRALGACTSQSMRVWLAAHLAWEVQVSGFPVVLQDARSELTAGTAQRAVQVREA